MGLFWSLSECPDIRQGKPHHPHTLRNMHNHSLRNRIAASTLTLPVTSLITVATWLLPFLNEADAGQGNSLWAGLAFAAIITYLLAEWNNRNALLRVRSRMVSSTYLMLLAVCPVLHPLSYSMLPELCLILSYFALFTTYGNPHARGGTFHAFFFISLGSLCYAPLLLLAPAFLLAMAIQLRSLTGRTFGTAVLGLILPYWLMTGYALWDAQPESLGNRLAKLWSWQDPAWDFIQTGDASVFQALPFWFIGTSGTVAFLSIIAIVHYLRTAYNDKIRTRMLFYILITNEVLILAACCLLPTHHQTLLRLLLLNSSPIIAHHLTLSRGRSAEIWFWLCLTLLMVLAITNHLDLWNNWLSF